MDFDAALAAILGQIPRGRHATCGAVARALGDVAAAPAVAERVRENPRLPRRDAIATAEGIPLTGGRIHGEPFTRFRGGALLTQLRRRQLRERERLSLRGPTRFRTVCGIDVAYRGDRAFAAAVVTDASGADVLATASAVVNVTFPYIPGYLAFRELPAIQAAWRELPTRPELLLVDAHGIAHPAGFGAACAAGLALDAPTIGVAKSRLTGSMESAPAPGTLVRLVIDGAQRGWVLRPTASRSLVYVSPGHRIGLPTCGRIIPPLCRSGIPEPIRMADRECKEMKRKEIKS